MKRLITAALVLVLAAAPAFPHAGEVHTYMGTVSAVGDDASFTMKTKDGAELNVVTTKDTSYAFADGSRAAFSDLTPGRRIVVTLAKDARTATMIKLGRR